MDFFEKLGKDMTIVGKEVGEKAKDLTKKAKLQANITSEELKIKEEYYNLGKKYYSVFADAPVEEVADIVTKIKGSEEKIEEYKQELKNENQ